MRILPLIALAAATPASAAPSVEAAQGDWSAVPLAVESPRVPLAEQAFDRIDALLARGKCERLGRGKRVRMDVPFLMRFDASGTLMRVVVQKLDCPEIEAVIGSAVVARAEAGAWRPTGENRTGWYRSAFRYHLD